VGVRCRGDARGPEGPADRVAQARSLGARRGCGRLELPARPVRARWLVDRRRHGRGVGRRRRRAPACDGSTRGSPHASRPSSRSHHPAGGASAGGGASRRGASRGGGTVGGRHRAAGSRARSGDPEAFPCRTLASGRRGCSRSASVRWARLGRSGVQRRRRRTRPAVACTAGVRPVGVCPVGAGERTRTTPEPCTRAVAVQRRTAGARRRGRPAGATAGTAGRQRAVARAGSGARCRASPRRPPR
jgi:hypothetical protein